MISYLLEDRMKPIVPEEMKQFNYLSSEIDAAYHEVAQRLGLSDSAMLVLYAICNHGQRCLLSDICRLSGTSKQTINSALRKLESDGMIYLEAATGRKKAVCLTERGKALVDSTVARVIEVENEIFASWSEQELKQYLALTRKYLISFKNKIKEF